MDQWHCVGKCVGQLIEGGRITLGESAHEGVGGSNSNPDSGGVGASFIFCRQVGGWALERVGGFKNNF